MEKNVFYKIVAGVFVVVAAIAGVSLSLVFDDEYTTFYRDGTIIARERWEVHAERTYFNLDSWYDENVKCPRVIEDGGRKTRTRCYYPEDYYESMSRSLIGTDIYASSDSIFKETPYYAYGTRGSYAGILTERFDFINPTTDIEEFPKNYSVEWKPRDTRNYQLVWRISYLKNVDKQGRFYDCQYQFGYAKIDLRESCEQMEYVEIQGNTLRVYYTPMRDNQYLKPILIDPELKVVSLGERFQQPSGKVMYDCQFEEVEYVEKTPIRKDVTTNREVCLNTSGRNTDCITQSVPQQVIVYNENVKTRQVCKKINGFFVDVDSGQKYISESKAGVFYSNGLVYVVDRTDGYRPDAREDFDYEWACREESGAKCSVYNITEWKKIRNSGGGEYAIS